MGNYYEELKELREKLKKELKELEVKLENKNLTESEILDIQFQVSVIQERLNNSKQLVDYFNSPKIKDSSQSWKKDTE